MDVLIFPFGLTQRGERVMRYTLVNDNACQVDILDYGGAIAAWLVPDRFGRLADITLGFDTLAAYEAHTAYFGAIIGRYANRIADGRFSLDGVDYQVERNDGPHHLHGGFFGFDKVVWSAMPDVDAGGARLTLTHISFDHDAGYPGRLDATVVYTLQPDNALRIDYTAVAHAPTIVNLTNHAYFNLAGHDAGAVDSHHLTLHAGVFTPVDETLIPTGELRPVAGTSFDFCSPQRIGDRLQADDAQVRAAGGFDHNFVLNAAGDIGQTAARLAEPESGRVLEVATSAPGLQFYTGNHLYPMQGKGGARYDWRGGLCLEAQHFPDSPNQPHFPPVVLHPGERYRQTTLYRFATA